MIFMRDVLKVDTHLTEREIIESMHVSVIKELGLEDISVRRYTTSSRPVTIVAKYTCRYNSWEVTILHKKSIEYPEGTITITNIESLIYGDNYKLSIALNGSKYSLAQLCEIKNIIDGDPRAYLESVSEIITDLEHTLRSYGFSVSGIINPDLFYSQGMITCTCKTDGTYLYLSLAFNELGERCLCLSNSLHWRNKSQNTEFIRGELFPLKTFETNNVLDFLRNSLHKTLLFCQFYKQMAECYSWNT